jgi:hypothetical protein
VTLLIATIAVVLIAMLGLGVGVLLGGRPLHGSCGGKEIIGPDGEPLSCASCPNRRPDCPNR